MTRPRSWTLRALAAACLATSAVIHLWLVPDHLTEMPYIGWLFAASVIVLAVIAGAVGAGDRLTAWRAGAVVCAAMIAALVCSRTIGLPGGYLEDWDPPAVWSLLVEAGFLVLYLGFRRQPVAPVGSRRGR